MRLLLDEDSQGRTLIRRLRDAGHDVLTLGEADVIAASDAEVRDLARKEKRVLLTRNVRDYRALHDENPAHPGILIEYQDRDRSRNMTYSQIVSAIGNIERTGWDITGHFASLNTWNFQSEQT